MKRIFIILTFILLSLYNGLLVFIFYITYDPFFLKAVLLFVANLGLFYLYKRKVLAFFRFVVPLLIIISIGLSVFFTLRVYILMTGLYLDGTVVISINGKMIEKEDSKRLKELFLNLEEYNATVGSSNSTYTLSYSGIDDPDTLHIHIFEEEKLVLNGCLLGVGKGDRLEGYLLTDELLDVVERNR